MVCRIVVYNDEKVTLLVAPYGTLRDEELTDVAYGLQKFAEVGQVRYLSAPKPRYDGQFQLPLSPRKLGRSIDDEFNRDIRPRSLGRMDYDLLGRDRMVMYS